MNDPHTLRPPLPATIKLLCDQIAGLRRGVPTPPAGVPRNPSHPPVPAHPFRPKPLPPRQYEVLQAVADQRIQRDILLGTLEPHLLNGHDVSWTLRALVIQRLGQLQPIGPPRLTTRGRRTLDSPD
jgi:hypothetical protein